MSAYREAILARDDFKCCYCGFDANAVDHIVPVKYGGSNRLENFVAACTSCNVSKRSWHWRTWYCTQYRHTPEREMFIENRLEYPSERVLKEERAVSTVFRLFDNFHQIFQVLDTIGIAFYDDWMMKSLLEYFDSIEDLYAQMLSDKTDVPFDEFKSTHTVRVSIPPPWQEETLTLFPMLKDGLPIKNHPLLKKDTRRIEKALCQYKRAKKQLQIFGNSFHVPGDVKWELFDMDLIVVSIAGLIVQHIEYTENLAGVRQ